MMVIIASVAFVGSLICAALSGVMPNRSPFTDKCLSIGAVASLAVLVGAIVGTVLP